MIVSVDLALFVANCASNIGSTSKIRKMLKLGYFEQIFMTKVKEFTNLRGSCILHSDVVIFKKCIIMCL